MKTCLITAELMQLPNHPHDNIIDAKSNNSCNFFITLALWPCSLAVQSRAENIKKYLLIKESEAVRVMMGLILMASSQLNISI